MCIRDRHDPANDVMPLLAKVRDEVAVLQPPAFSRTPHTFSHIFAGGYAAGYYSCLLYTSDAADERSSVDLGGRRIIKKKKYRNHSEWRQWSQNKKHTE